MNNIKVNQASLLIDAKSQLGEGPIWHPNENILYWVDITQGILNCWNPSTGRTHQWEMGSMIGTVALVYPEGLLVALESGIHLFSHREGLQKLVDFPEPPEMGNRFNDGKCDASGRLWVGTMNKQVQAKAGSLYCYDGQTLISKLSELTISNGMAWSVDQRTFYFIDTVDYAVVAFDFDNQTGNISNKRKVINVTSDMGAPDGITIDCDGMLWIAHWGGSCVARWNPENGELLERVEVPAPNVSCCSFGGEDLQTLYITTAREGLTEKQLLEFPLSGGVFFYKAKTAGINGFCFQI